MIVASAAQRVQSCCDTIWLTKKTRCGAAVSGKSLAAGIGRAETKALRPLDSEVAKDVAVRTAIFRAGSIRLASRLNEIFGNRCIIDDTTWGDLLQVLTPSGLEDILNAGLSTRFGLVPLMDNAMSHPEFLHLAETRFAMEEPLSPEIMTTLICERDTRNRADLVARIIRTQVSAYPVEMSAIAADGILVDPRIPCAMLLAGLDPQWIIRAADLRGLTAEGYPSLMRSSHGRLRLLEELESLENILRSHVVLDATTRFISEAPL